jgi:L-asparaginase
MKKILHISTGGTIAQQKNPDGIAVPADHDNLIHNKLNDLATKYGMSAQIDSIAILNKDSSNIIPSDWRIIIDTIVEKYDDYDAFIITHGTNTLGYTAAALSFALGKIGKRIILTGSQVSYGYIGSDAEMNMANSIRMATYDKHHIAGVFAVFGSNIITGTRVKKTTEFDYDAFKTFGGKNSIGRIGRTIRIDDRAALQIHMQWLKPHADSQQDLIVKSNFETNIISLTEYPGMSSETLIKLVDLGIKGIIYRASGAGDPNIGNTDATFPNLRAGFEYLREKKIPIVVTTQAADGIASMDVNEPGMLACELGAIPAWDMSIEAMTVKLMWLLGQNITYEEIQTQMVTSIRGEIDPY